MVKEAMKGKITFNRDMDLEIICHKEDHLTPSINVPFMAIIFHVINLGNKFSTVETMQ